MVDPIRTLVLPISICTCKRKRNQETIDSRHLHISGPQRGTKHGVVSLSTHLWQGEVACSQVVRLIGLWLASASQSGSILHGYRQCNQHVLSAPS
eukprot:73182-Pelagomonas_calceolata.AAC.1